VTPPSRDVCLHIAIALFRTDGSSEANQSRTCMIIYVTPVMYCCAWFKQCNMIENSFFCAICMAVLIWCIIFTRIQVTLVLRGFALTQLGNLHNFLNICNNICYNAIWHRWSVVVLIECTSKFSVPRDLA
jgi:hypothetical protein